MDTPYDIYPSYGYYILNTIIITYNMIKDCLQYFII